MSNMKRLWILGTSDPEMSAIEKLLAEAGEHVSYAINKVLSRVHPGNMYEASGAFGTLSPHQGGDSLNLVTLSNAGWEIITVECDIPGQDITHHIDHHREGDAGFGLSPERYLEASSIGQVIFQLSLSVRHSIPALPWMSEYVVESMQGFSVRSCVSVLPASILMVAAADHCLGAAYSGECPGIDVDAFIEFRLCQRAEFQGRPVEDVRADTEAARIAIMSVQEQESDEECWEQVVKILNSVGIGPLKRGE